MRTYWLTALPLFFQFRRYDNSVCAYMRITAEVRFAETAPSNPNLFSVPDHSVVILITRTNRKPPASLFL